MKPASPGVRFALWINENEGLDANHAGRVRVAKKVNAMVKAEMLKERRRCARICENMAKDADAQLGGHTEYTGAALSIRLKILRGERP